MEDDAVAVVIDNGSRTCKAGFAGDDSPRSIFPSVVGRPRHAGIILTNPDTYVGDAAQAKREALALRHPVEHGIVTNWDDMEKIWHHAFHDELRISPEEHNILLTECSMNPRRNRELMTQIMFEGFNPPALNVANQAVLALYASAPTGVVLDVGHDSAYITPVCEGSVLSQAVQRVDLGGRDLTHYLASCLVERGYEFAGTAAMSADLSYLKRTRCYVAEDYCKERTEAQEGEVAYELAGGIVALGHERFQVPEVLFNLGLVGFKASSSPGVHKAVYASILQCDAQLRREMFNNVVLAGASTLFPGFEERLQMELQILAPNDKVRIVTPKDRQYSAWIGGSIYASSTIAVWCSKKEYEEVGPNIIHRKCL